MTDSAMPIKSDFCTKCGETGSLCSCEPWCSSCGKPKVKCLGQDTCAPWCSNCGEPVCVCPKIQFI